MYVKRKNEIISIHHPCFYSLGWSMRASSELAGLGLDSNLVRFSKQEINAQVCMFNHKITPNDFHSLLFACCCC